MEQPYMLELVYLKDKPVTQSKFLSHANYEIYYFHEGKGNYLIGDKIYVLSPGDLIIMHGMTLHRPKIDNQFTYIRSTINFDPTFFKRISEELFSLNILEPFEQLGNYRINLKEGDRNNFEELLAKTYELNSMDDAVSYKRSLLSIIDILIVIYGYCQNLIKQRGEQSSEKVNKVQLVISYLESHYVDDVTMDQLAKELHLNKYYLSRVFREITGVTIFNYLYQLRINQAKIGFLMEKKKTVTEICHAVGFKNLSHFSRMFKQQVGCTPEHFRRHITNDVNLSKIL